MRLGRQEGRQSWADTMRASAAAVEGAHNWRGYLPDAWADRVEAPLWVEEFQEYQLDAQRWVGYDADEQPCYTAHHYALPAQDALQITDDKGVVVNFERPPQRIVSLLP